MMLNKVIPFDPNKTRQEHITELQCAATEQQLRNEPNHPHRVNLERLVKHYQDGGLMPKHPKDGRWLVDGQFVDYIPTDEEKRTKVVMKEFVMQYQIGQRHIVKGGEQIQTAQTEARSLPR